MAAAADRPSEKGGDAVSDQPSAAPLAGRRGQVNAVCGLTAGFGGKAELILSDL